MTTTITPEKSSRIPHCTNDIKCMNYSSSGDFLFLVFLSITLMTFIISGITAGKFGIRPRTHHVNQTVIQTTFEFAKTLPVKPLPPKVKIPEASIKTEPVDLTVAQPQVDPKEELPEPPQKPVRKVYGLRRVFSTGLGNGGNGEERIVTKIGNTINTSYDTLTATDTDIKGDVVSVALISAAPKFRKIVKPVYTKEMIDNKVQGTVKVKVLVDIDGRVKKATCIDDIGFGSADAAVKASLAMEFEPGIRDNDPVAVWIIIPINFMLLS